MRFIGIKVNEEEELIHNWLKDFLGFKDHFGEDSQTFKQSEIIAYNVLRNTFGDKLSDIFKRESRDRLLEIRAIQQEKIKKSKTLNKENKGKG